MHRELQRLRQGEASLEFKQILDKAMARDRGGRYYTALDFGRAMPRLRGDTYGHTMPFIGEGVEKTIQASIQVWTASGRTWPIGAAADLSASRNLHGGSGRRPAWAGSDATAGQDADATSVSSRVRPAMLAEAVLLAAALAALALGLFVLPDRDGARSGRAVTDAGSGPSSSVLQETDAG